MYEKYKVGHMSWHGLLVAEAIKGTKDAKQGSTVSMYLDTEQSAYLIIEWEKDGLSQEYEANRTWRDNKDEADKLFVKLAFGIVPPEPAQPEIWDTPDKPTESPKSPTWGPWGQEGRSGN